ncbi:hypothetical protein PV387_35205 [Streptomyces sp. ME02-6987-2C]|nr:MULTISPECIES: hypothetical protein [unclassified Streptomyces]MDX3371187.1 hypothetical protein [Streptomyces sp. ME02-6987-2C]MDX3426990.1 hypothetical protein [Streptomyces sp. ME02-6985-2c]
MSAQLQDEVAGFEWTMSSLPSQGVPLGEEAIHRFAHVLPADAGVFR